MGVELWAGTLENNGLVYLPKRTIHAANVLAVVMPYGRSRFQRVGTVICFDLDVHKKIMYPQCIEVVYVTYIGYSS